MMCSLMTFARLKLRPADEGYRDHADVRDHEHKTHESALKPFPQLQLPSCVEVVVRGKAPVQTHSFCVHNPGHQHDPDGSHHLVYMKYHRHWACARCSVFSSAYDDLQSDYFCAPQFQMGEPSYSATSTRSSGWYTIMSCRW